MLRKLRNAYRRWRFNRKYNRPETRAYRNKKYPLKINENAKLSGGISTIDDLYDVLDGIDRDTSIIVQVNGEFILHEIVAIELKQTWLGGMIIDPDKSLVISVAIPPND